MSEQRFRYDGKRVIVTGCASGMGAATAQFVGDLGAKVTGLDINDASASVAEFVHVDMSDRASIDRAVAAIDGPVDALFNCAGVSGSGPALRVATINFIGLRHLTESIVDQMPEGGAIASVSSMAGVGYDKNLSPLLDFLQSPSFESAYEWCEAHPEQFTAGGYGFAKQAIIVYTALRAVPFAAKGIRINSLSPGVTETPMLVESRKVADVDGFPKPLGRVSRPDEQAAVLAFLNSDAASYITGQNIWADGGYLAGMLTGTITR
jgi:NAD(P)-dependent dehydrogenase (short-subunit alcohol dehydrogenase family)